MFLAKSNSETLVQHTNNLLDQLDLLKKTYPNILSSHHWKLLQYACAYHDLGKINDKFQYKIRRNMSVVESEIPHGLLSITMIDFKTLSKEFTQDELKILAYAVANHHNRDFSSITKDYYKEQIKELAINEAKLDLSSLKINLPVRKPRFVSSKYYKFKHIWTINDILEDPYLDPSEIPNKLRVYELFVKIKGLLNRLDYAASGHYFIESSSRINEANNILSYLGKSANYNALQNWTYDHQDQSIVVVAQTGLGKTESALRWMNNSKSFFILPLKTAINSMYDRLTQEIFQGDLDKVNSNMAILHSDMLNILSNNKKLDSVQTFNNEVNEDRQWSKQLSIATLDQIFNFVYHYKGYEPKLATLSYAKVVIDEIQMYSPDLLAYIIYGLKEIQDYGGKFDIMTATLAPAVLDLLKENNIKFIISKHAFLDNKINHRHKVKTMHQELTSEDILKLDQNQKTLVIVNTVTKAIELYNDLKQANKNVHLIHSHFTRKDRSIKEHEINDFAHNSDSHGIWIGTQVVEASLDIDFDLLITELSELNSLFQRMGRCYRKRNYEGQNPNVYVFDGGGKPTSGINHSEHSVVDYQMFELSKNVIKNLDNYLTEEDKLKLINDNYTTEKLSNSKKTGFIDQVKKDYAYLISMQSLQTNKSQVKKIFRNLQTVDVIPEKLYLENKNKIDIIAEKLANKNFSDKIESIKAREKLNNLLVNTYSYVAKSENLVDNKNLNALGYKILSKNFEYSSETGLNLKKNNEDQEDDNDHENIF